MSTAPEQMAQAAAAVNHRVPWWHSVVWFTVGLLSVLVLHMVSARNYLFFHSLVELFSVAVSVAIFVIGWNTRRIAGSGFIITIAIAYLAVAALDTLHTLVYKGMGIFPEAGTNIPTQLWLVARTAESASFLVAAVVLARRVAVRPVTMLLGYILLTVALVATVWPLEIFPMAYDERAGMLTPFKVASEYGIIAVFALALLLLWRQRHQLDHEIAGDLYLALALKIISEGCFTLYSDVYGFPNFLGHIFKTGSVIAIYLALVVGTLRRPYSSLFRELTASREEALRRAAEIDATLASVADGLLIYGPSGEILRANTAAESILQYTPEETHLPIPLRLRLVHMSTLDGQPIPIEESAPMRALRGETLYGQVVTLRRDHQRITWVSLSAAPIRTPEGKQLGAVITLTDITSLHELQQEREVYIHTISHDLRAPLTIIQGHATLLADDPAVAGASAEARDSVAAIAQAARRMNIMIQDLVDSARLETGGLTLAPRAVPVRPYLEELLRRARPLLGVDRVALDIPADLPPVEADPDRLERILVNLLTNALKYSPSTSPVTVSARREGDEVVFAVRDCGVGISAEDLPHIFERFYRVKGRRVEGVGLGLSITRALVQAHGGRIWAESTPGVGSTFFFTLPIAS